MSYDYDRESRHLWGVACNTVLPFFGFIHLVDNFCNRKKDHNLDYLISGIFGGIAYASVCWQFFPQFGLFAFIFLVAAYLHLVNIILCAINGATNFAIKTNFRKTLLITYFAHVVVFVVTIIVLGAVLQI